MVKRVRPARHWQRKDAPVRRLADAARAPLARDFKEALKHLGELLPPQAVELAKAGRIEDLKHHINWGHYREVLKGPFGRMGKVWQAAAEIGVGQINAAFKSAGKRVRYRRVHVVRKDIGDLFNFDFLDQATQDRIRELQDQLIRELEVGARDAIDGIVTAGVRAGLSPEEIVDDIRELIGLTSSQANAVLNYEAMLRDLDPGALTRQLRAMELDDEVMQAIDEGVDLSEAMIEQLVAAYTDNYLDYRAATIAQTESVRASNAGLQDAYQQAIDRGALPEDAVRVNWTVALDEQTCEICLSIPELNPDGRPVGEAFDSVDGPQDAPPDPHPNCRCSLDFVTDLSMVDDTEETFA